MSVNIVAFGNERDGFSEDSQQPSLIWSYLGRSALISQIDSSLSASHVGNPVFTEYQACVFGNVRLVVHDCPIWDIFASDWYTSCRLIGGADIIVIKYSVNDKTSFQELKDSYVPMVKKALNHCSVPVIISAIGARKNGVPCTCPLCTSDRRSCVTTSEGVQLAKELGATYLELHTLNDFYIQKYFGGVLEYFMIQSLNQKSSEKMKKRKKIQKCHRVQPPQLEQPEKMPILKGEASHYNTDLHNLLCGCQCADVAFYPEDLSTVAEAHKVILCSVSPLFMLLFGVKSPADIPDTSIVQMAQSLFAVEAGAASPLAPYGAPPCILPIRVVVKDSVFCSCLPDILLFIYSGAFQWERLEEDIKKKLKDPEKTEQVLEKVKCILKTPGKQNSVKVCRSHQIKQLYNTSLKLFFNTPVLADVIFKIQGLEHIQGLCPASHFGQSWSPHLCSVSSVKRPEMVVFNSTFPLSISGCCWLWMCLSCPSRSRHGLASSGFTSMGNPAMHIYVLEFDDLQIWCHQHPPHFTAQHAAVSFLEIKCVYP
ncbi:PREDICTED: rho-related BTB domain-containing protein 3 isoform X2 [Lepidothrix coronata]|uniref:Rho-related BTB domain-containing protein 3 isoform X2 n=1 Tax=Lepidothrix coronata TaxID=321398 RepID=A0A6J0H2C6_9PASS|nr:PREDICTED: rho-related BTB domain-containing protein 3 isoform X2 [Lepidothrix coronata]